jgi:quercetin dioxygenase-like cupin family protein
VTPPGITRTELQRHDLGVPGRDVVQVRIDLGQGEVFGTHTPPGEAIIAVLDGALAYQVEGKPPTTRKAGDVLCIPARTIHAAKNVGVREPYSESCYCIRKGDVDESRQSRRGPNKPCAL